MQKTVIHLNALEDPTRAPKRIAKRKLRFVNVKVFRAVVQDLLEEPASDHFTKVLEAIRARLVVAGVPETDPRKVLKASTKEIWTRIVKERNVWVHNRGSAARFQPFRYSQKKKQSGTQKTWRSFHGLVYDKTPRLAWQARLWRRFTEIALLTR